MVLLFGLSFAPTTFGPVGTLRPSVYMDLLYVLDYSLNEPICEWPMTIHLNWLFPIQDSDVPKIPHGNAYDSYEHICHHH